MLTLPPLPPPPPPPSPQPLLISCQAKKRLNIGKRFGNINSLNLRHNDRRGGVVAVAGVVEGAGGVVVVAFVADAGVVEEEVVEILSAQSESRYRIHSGIFITFLANSRHFHGDFLTYLDLRKSLAPRLT